MHELPDYNKITFPENPPIPFEEVVPDASPEALALLKKFLVYQSKKRISAKEVGLTIYIHCWNRTTHYPLTKADKL